MYNISGTVSTGTTPTSITLEYQLFTICSEQESDSESYSRSVSTLHLADCVFTQIELIVGLVGEAGTSLGIISHSSKGYSYKVPRDIEATCVSSH